MRGWLGSYPEERPLQRLRQVDGEEAASCKAIILSTFIDDAEIAVGYRVLVRDHAIKLPLFKGCFGPLVPDAHGEPHWSLA